MKAIRFIALFVFTGGLVFACTTEVREPSVPPMRDVAIDLIPYARLSASKTAPAYPLSWPREAQDAIACVRDDDEASSWKAPEGASTIEIDLLPWVGKQVALDSLAFEWEKGVPKALHVDLLDHIQGEIVTSLEPKTNFAELNAQKAGALRIFVEASKGLELKNLHLLSRDGTITDYSPTLATQTIRFPDSGVIEGFYGVPWSWRERRNMIQVLAANGLGSYLYAPKWDQLHRDNWRQAYDPSFVQAFSELARFASERHVRLVFGISPLKDYDAKTPADYETLLAKLNVFAAAGVRDFCLLADDIEFDLARPIDATLGQEHASLAKRLLEDLHAKFADIRLSFVPTVYSDARLVSMEDGNGYLTALAGLPLEVGIYWTGPDTSVATMNAADMQSIRALIGRKPIIWDNYWANDGGDGFTGRLLLGALEGRSTDLPQAVGGLMFNLSIQGASSRLALYTVAEYLADPQNYSKEKALQSASAAETAFSLHSGQAQSDAALLQLLMNTFNGNAKQEPRAQQLALLLEESSDTLAQGLTPSAQQIESLLAQLIPLSGLSSAMHHSALDPDLIDDLSFPLLRAEAIGKAGLWALHGLGGESKACESARAVLKSAQSLRFPLESGIENFMQLACAKNASRLTLLPKNTEVWPNCISGQPLTFSPFMGAAKLWISGLPGAQSSGETITFTPLHAGRFSGYVAGLLHNPLSIGIVPYELVCTDRP